MPLTALGLLLVAAILHTTWNLIVKRAQEKQVFIWCALIAGAICFSPLLLTNPVFPISLWPYLLSSALFEAIYYITLIRAYENGDFSLVYPMARGAAPVFLVAWAALFLGESPRLYGLIGIALLVLGLVVVGGKTWWTLRKTSTLSKSALLLALGVACCISIYTTIDGAAVRHVNPLPYTTLVIALSGVLVTPAVVKRYGRRAIAAEWRTNWMRIVLVGIFTFLAYTLALKAYTITRVSYAGSVREISVVFAALLGWRWLGEGVSSSKDPSSLTTRSISRTDHSEGLIRLLGSVLVFIGILVIAVSG